MERADAGSSGHFPLFSALGFTSTLCITLSSPQLAEGATAAQLGVAHRVVVPHILTFDGFKQLQHGDDGLQSYARPFIGPTHNHAKVLSALKSLIQHAWSTDSMSTFWSSSIDILAAFLELDVAFHGWKDGVLIVSG